MLNLPPNRTETGPMAKNGVGLSDDHLCSLVTRATELLGRENLEAEHRSSVERLNAMSISEVIRRLRARLPKEAHSRRN